MNGEPHGKLSIKGYIYNTTPEGPGSIEEEEVERVEEPEDQEVSWKWLFKHDLNKDSNIRQAKREGGKLMGFHP